MIMKNWLLAFRPKTLTAAIVPIFVGTSLTAALGYPIKIWISLCALFVSLFIQIGTNLVNDAMDFKKGADNHDRIGPARITLLGHASFKHVLTIGIVFFALALFLGIPLVLHGGWPILFIGVFSLFFGYTYTGGPFPLAYHGFGDIFVLLFFGVISVSGMTYLQTGEWFIEALFAGFQIGALATVLIAINNGRDYIGDGKVNKKTLAVRFGPLFIRYEILFLILSSFLLNYYWWMEGFKIAAVLSTLSFPLGILVLRNIFCFEPSPKYNQFLAQSALLHLLFGSLLSLGFII